MAERPDYVPRLWTQGPVNRRFQSSPRRVLVWLVVVAVFGIVLTTALFAAGPQGRFPYVMGVATVIGVLNALIYGPRAYRAMRRVSPPE
jgi:hypothetical protein